MPLKLQFENPTHSTLRLTWVECGLDYMFHKHADETEADLIQRVVYFLQVRDLPLAGEDLQPQPWR